MPHTGNEADEPCRKSALGRAVEDEMGSGGPGRKPWVIWGLGAGQARTRSHLTEGAYDEKA
jgi:hypothetical protein